MKPTSVLFALALLGIAGCSDREHSDSAPAAGLPEASGTTSSTVAPGTFAVSSPAFADNTRIPAEFSCDDRNVPPPLRWQDVPPGTQSLAVVVDDPDAPAGPYVHWVVTGMPPSTTEIAAGGLPESAEVSLNSAGRAEYRGPCPPAGTGDHHYRFKVYALSQSLTLDPTTPATESTTTIADLSIAVGVTVGVFSH